MRSRIWRNGLDHLEKMWETEFKKQVEEERPTHVTDEWPKEGKQQRKWGGEFQEENTPPFPMSTPLKAPHGVLYEQCVYPRPQVLWLLC